MKVALHNDITFSDGDVASVIESCARQAGFDEVSIVSFAGSIDLMDEMAPAKGQTIDIVVAPYALADTPFTAVLDEMRVELPLVYSIVFDNGTKHAAQAAEASIDGYLIEPVSSARFEAELERILGSLQRLYAASFVISSSVGQRRLPFHAVLYCETSGHDQILHLESGRTLTARYSSQALFDLVADDGRFFKVGSSYIVNLNEVVEANTPSGTLALTNGAKLPVPFRIRKPLERTLLDWRPK